MSTSPRADGESVVSDTEYLRDVETTLNEWQGSHDEAAYCALADAIATPDDRSSPMTHAELVYQHLKQMPESVAAEVLDFVQFLEQKHGMPQPAAPRQPGSAQGLVWMADDFDAPLDDFKDYR